MAWAQSACSWGTSLLFVTACAGLSLTACAGPRAAQPILSPPASIATTEQTECPPTAQTVSTLSWTPGEYAMVIEPWVKSTSEAEFAMRGIHAWDSEFPFTVDYAWDLNADDGKDAYLDYQMGFTNPGTQSATPIALNIHDFTVDWLEQPWTEALTPTGECAPATPSCNAH